MDGVQCCIDAVGCQARDRKDYAVEKPSHGIEDIARLLDPTGSIGLIGAYTAEDPGAGDGAKKHGTYLLPLGELWHKGVRIGMGQCPVKNDSPDPTFPTVAHAPVVLLLVNSGPPLPSMA
jgi:glutathione-independent formaldehyde dehydrogenase